MKKTIAILLVLVIGMVGVFAAIDDNAKLHLQTTVHEYTQLIITEFLPEGGFDWGSFGNSGDSTGSSTYTTTESRKSIDPYVTSVQSVGFLHSRTNRRGGYNISVAGTPLKSELTITVDGDQDQEIHYYIYNDGAGAVYDTEDPTVAEFVVEEYGSGMRQKSTPIRISLKTSGDLLSAGDYVGDITFSYTAQ